jgi:hypothetical protein
MLDAGCGMLDFLRAKPLEKLYDYMSYRNLEIWKLAKTLVADVHKMLRPECARPRAQQFSPAKTP